MNFRNQYWYFSNQFSKQFCDSVIAYGNQKREGTGVTGDIKSVREKLGKKAEGKSDDEVFKLAEKEEIKELDFLKKQRNSNIAWLNEQWLYNEIMPYIRTANENAGWNFEWDWCESIQFTKYKLNQYYGWHKDSWDEAYGEDHGKNFEGKIRKLSCIVSLSDSSEYKGGELEFCFDNVNPDQPRNIFECQEIKPKGSIVVFPSHIYHQVKPVTEGTRYSLVIWCLGKPFR